MSSMPDLASFWPEIAKIHVSAQAVAFLAKLYDASALEQETWADLLFVDTDQAASLAGLAGGQGSELMARITFLGDLEQKGLLEMGPRFGGGPLVDRLTYLAAVRLGQTAERDLSGLAVSAGASGSAQQLGLKPVAPRPKGRPKGSGYIADRHSVLEAYRRAKARRDRNPSRIPSVKTVAKELDVGTSTLADFIRDEGITWPPE
jgi:hypothetical protein